MPASYRIPHLPAAARKAGATQIRRCSGNVFSVGYALVRAEDGSLDLRAPGNGPAVVAALEKWAAKGGPRVEWAGDQSCAIVLTF